MRFEGEGRENNGSAAVNKYRMHVDRIFALPVPLPLHDKQVLLLCPRRDIDEEAGRARRTQGGEGRSALGLSTLVPPLDNPSPPTKRGTPFPRRGELLHMLHDM